MRFHIVDVFTQRRYAGNQLAVVESRGELSDDEMQRIAAEMDYSETTFIESFDPSGGYDVRIFTPSEEIPFAGHPTLGTAAVLRERTGADEIDLELPVGTIPVRTEGDGEQETLWMTQRQPEFGERLEREPVARALSLSPDDLSGDHPVQIVSTGLPTIIVPLTGRVALERASIDRAAYDALVESRDAKNVFIFCAEPRSDDNDLAARMFAPYLGVPEDPATGSANGCLAGYLVEQRGDDVALRVEQGYEMGRPSVLHLRADEHSNSIDVGGSVVRVATGELL
ncbi:PhzF family phenazine biosynthesis protein [Halocatena pleomorpha]|uniref:PhzF family phenazine biosynthesis protein n=1 Tax=Halocatena pleomorpha TaxID=1785090 RepID=A0A3P3R4P8_9EURY|nr:PhzF family phenazine biosynthesis protein [Halocatena pleomorpha]RRJ28442.1 PhzF family phenazine biosynthesis protein [Halocatena pleomorpha]